MDNSITWRLILSLCLSGILFVRAVGQQEVVVASPPGSSYDNEHNSFLDKAVNFPDKLLGSITIRTERYQKKLLHQTARYMDRLARTEKKLQRKLAKKNTAAAQSIFGNVDSSYQAMQERLQNPMARTFKMGDAYSGHLDSMQTALKFLQQDKILGGATDIQSKLQNSIGTYDKMQDQLNESVRIQKYLKERQQLLGGQLEKYGLGKQLLPFKKQVYYYRAQMEEYKAAFENPGQLENKLLEVLKRTSAFRDFFNNNAQLASIFRLPGTTTTGGGLDLTGLQTRSQIQAQLLQRFGSNEDVSRALQQQVSQGKNMMNRLKSKVNELGGSGSGMNMPEFKANDQKTKPFLRRLEYGFNLQSQRGNGWLPNSTDLGLSIGYKIKAKSVIGAGASYKMGLGNGLNHLAFTSEGIGLRSFIDIKIKGSIWASGGYEYNYLRGFRSIDALKDLDKWQRSGLIGLTKKYKVGKKQGNLQVLWDFLQAQQRPRSQALKVRVGYKL